MFDLKFGVYKSSKCHFRQITLFIRCQYSIGLELAKVRFNVQIKYSNSMIYKNSLSASWHSAHCCTLHHISHLAQSRWVFVMVLWIFVFLLRELQILLHQNIVLFGGVQHVNQKQRRSRDVVSKAERGRGIRGGKRCPGGEPVWAVAEAARRGDVKSCCSHSHVYSMTIWSVIPWFSKISHKDNWYGPVGYG